MNVFMWGKWGVKCGESGSMWRKIVCHICMGEMSLELQSTLLGKTRVTPTDLIYAY
jgi:hypothetical protein